MKKILEKIVFLQKNQEKIIEKMVLDGACSTVEKMKKECGLRIKVIHDLIDLYHQYQTAGKKNLNMGFEKEKKNLTLTQANIQSPSDKDQTISSEEIFQNILDILLPEKVVEQKDVIIEIRDLKRGHKNDYAGMLMETYKKYFAQMGWEFQAVKKRSLAFEVIGHKVFKSLQYEHGLHRFKYGQTSMLSVSVFPKTVKKTKTFSDKDLRIDVFRASGHGGQSVNTSNSAVRIIHIPTGTSAESQGQRSQYQNKKAAYKVLKKRVEQYYMHEKQEGLKRKNSQMVRLYDLENNLVSDYRIKMSFDRLDFFLKGDLSFIIDRIREKESLLALEKIIGH